MTCRKTTIIVVLAVALFAGSASAQTQPNEKEEDRTAILEELIESQESLIGQQQALIGQQQALIDEQEALLNTYRCRFKIDVEVVPGGCATTVLSEEEAADGTLLCAGWREEAHYTQLIVASWTYVATGLNNGEITMEASQLTRLSASVDEYRNRVLAIIPNLQSERFSELFGAMAEEIKAVADTYARGGSADEMVTVIFAALDQLAELEAALAEVCG